MISLSLQRNQENNLKLHLSTQNTTDLGRTCLGYHVQHIARCVTECVHVGTAHRIHSAPQRDNTSVKQNFPFCFPKEHFFLDLWIRKYNLVSQDNRENSTIINDAPSLIQRLLCSGTPLQYFCLENPMDGGAWWATVHGVTKNQTQLMQLSSSRITFGLLDIFLKVRCVQLKPDI